MKNDPRTPREQEIDTLIALRRIIETDQYALYYIDLPALDILNALDTALEWIPDPRQEPPTETAEAKQ